MSFFLPNTDCPLINFFVYTSSSHDTKLTLDNDSFLNHSSEERFKRQASSECYAYLLLPSRWWARQNYWLPFKGDVDDGFWILSASARKQQKPHKSHKTFCRCFFFVTLLVQGQCFRHVTQHLTSEFYSLYSITINSGLGKFVAKNIVNTLLSAEEEYTEVNKDRSVIIKARLFFRVFRLKRRSSKDSLDSIFELTFFLY